MHASPAGSVVRCAFRLWGWEPQGHCSEKVEPNSTSGEMQPVTLYNPAMSADKNITRKRGGHFREGKAVVKRAREWMRRASSESQ